VLNLKLLLCADSNSLDSRSNTISAFHILEDFNAASFPVALPRVTVVAMVDREETDPSDIELQLRVYLGDKELFAGPFALNFAQRLSARALIEMQGIVVPNPGVLSFVLLNADQIFGSWAIRVSQIGQPKIQMQLPQNPIPQ